MLLERLVSLSDYFVNSSSIEITFNIPPAFKTFSDIIRTTLEYMNAEHKEKKGNLNFFFK